MKKGILNSITLKHPKLAAFTAYGAMVLVGVLFAYFLMPVLLNYAPRKC